MLKAFRSLLWLALAAAGGAAHAHHSFPVHFVPDQTIEVTGTITEFRFTNPHGLAYFTVTGEDGAEQQWRAETNSPNILRRRGWSPDSLQQGDLVTIEGWPARDDEHYMRIRRVQFQDGRVLATQRGEGVNQD